VLTGLLFKNTLLRGEVTSFVMELPPYHMPTLSGVMYHTWHRLKSFIIKAGKVILLIVTVLGFLNSLGADGSFGNSDSKNSALSAMSRTVTPVFRPMGIEDENWPATVGLFTGIFAKESVVGTLDSIYSQMEETSAVAPGEERTFNFGQGIADAFKAIPAGFAEFGKNLLDPLGLSGAVDEVQDVSDKERYKTMVSHFGEHREKAAFSYMLFILIYAPCVAAMAAIAREIGLRWMVFAVSYLTVLAWIVSTLFFQSATFSAHPAASTGWIGGCLTMLAALIVGLRVVGTRVAKKC
jgi:ferrous iron transport protein B